MNKSDMGCSLLIDANVHVASDFGSAKFLGLRQGMRPTLSYSDLHFVCTVHDLEDILSPGESGDVVILSGTRVLLKHGFVVGSKFQLVAGAAIVGKGEVLEIRSVQVTRDRNAERGYSIVDGEAGRSI
ncbi:MAG: hypothetical protein AAF225_04140 [Pseudomonadota bacterium]